MGYHRICLIAGARPNFVKVAPILAELSRSSIDAFLVNTGQHYDPELSTVFFTELGIQQPRHSLAVGSGSHAQQTAEVMRRLEPVLQQEAPTAVLVVGDVNSTLAAALVAAKLNIRVIHVEAGLRSFDKSMPEEVNRIVTDSISDLLLVSEPSGVQNLRDQGVPDERCHLVGNVMIDTLVSCLPKISSCDATTRHGLIEREYAVLTLHRPSNVDHPETLAKIQSAIAAVQAKIPIVFPVHPRTRSKLTTWERDLPNVTFLPPLGYIDFLSVVKLARFVLTDSGGLQEETSFLNIPCITLRTNTERPFTVTHGTNQLVGLDPTRIIEAAFSALDGQCKQTRVESLWDGKAAQRIAQLLVAEAMTR